MFEDRVKLVPIAHAANLGEAIRVQMMLDRADLPYLMQGEKLYGIYGNAALGLAGPMAFLIPKELQAQAEASLMELFDVQPSKVACNCPACDAMVGNGEVDCPNCGLFLG